MDVERLPLARYLPELERLADAGVDLVLVAGQAVNFWAKFYSRQSEALIEFAPFVSKDVDLFGEVQCLYELPKILDGELKRFSDVRQSVVGIFTTNSDPPLVFELLRTLYGPVSSERILERSLHIGKIHLIDPISLLVCKVHNATGIDQERRQDIRHVKMMTHVVHAYYCDGLEKVGDLMTPRQFINEVRYLLDFAEDPAFQKGMRIADQTLRDCFPDDEIQTAGEKFESLGRFFDSTLNPALKTE